MLCGLPEYNKCECDVHRSLSYKPLTLLLLACWQREYDKRPYKHFQISKTFFEERMRRKFSEDDWNVLIEYLEKNKPKSVKICNIEMPAFKNIQPMENLLTGLAEAETIELKNVSLPLTFLSKLREHIGIINLKNLILSTNHLTSEHLILLQCILIHSGMLKHLNVENCFINENTFAFLANGIYKSKSIDCIDISRPCPMSSVSIFESYKFVNIVAQLLCQNKLTQLIMRNCNINGHDMESISEYLAIESSRLIELDLQSNNIGSQGTEYLFNALAKTKTLRKLNLSANNLGSAGGLIIAKYISYTRITTLDITKNKIGSEAMFDFLCVIKKPCELKALRIYGNEFNSKVATVVKRLLRANVMDGNAMDCTYTWDHSSGRLCVIPFFEIGSNNV